MTRVLLVEDDPMSRELLEIYINRSEEYVLVRSIQSAAFAPMCCSTLDISLILMDVCTDLHASGLEAAEQIKRNYPEIRIIIITSQPEFSFLDRARAAGAEGFWYKNASFEEILSIMDCVMAGGTSYPTSAPILQLGDASSPLFSARELEVLRLVVAGQTDAEIAEMLHLSLRTVKGHIQSMREKTGFRNRTELAVRARAAGIVINELLTTL